MAIDTQKLRELLARQAELGEWKKVDKMPYLHAFPSGVSTDKHWEVPCVGRFDYGEGNLEFVAAAHNEMPALLDHIDAQAAEIERLRQLSHQPALGQIISEIHRRADKEWADEGHDFTVTITADEYRALCDEGAARAALSGEGK